MKIAIVRKFNKGEGHYKKDLVRLGLQYVSKNPDYVLTIGGDGTLLDAERKYPGVPKIPVRESKICVMCQHGSVAGVLSRLQKKRVSVVRYPKIEARLKGKSFLAANDFIIRNKRIQEALRFTVKVNGKQQGDIVIGDGVVVATSFGSTGYYHSITYKPFKKGFGVAFNNPTKKMKPLLLKEKDIVEFILLRGQGLLAMDNYDKVVPMKVKDTVRFMLSAKTTNIVK